MKNLVRKIETGLRRFISQLILFLKKALNMTRSFKEFSENDLYVIERLLDNLSVDLPLSQKLPNAKRQDIRNDFAVLEYSNLHERTYEDYLKSIKNPFISFVINDKFDIQIFGLNNGNDINECKNEIIKYLTKQNFIK